MASWKAHLTHDRLDIICLQETHVSSLTQANTLTTTWTRMWGLTSTPHPIAYWTVTEDSTHGVAILLNPFSRLAFTEDRASSIPGRYIQISSATLTVASVYAPSTSTRDQQEFFRRLTSLTPPATPLLVGGDFNCVSHPRWDRHLTNPARPLGSECDAMELWLTRLQLCEDRVRLYPIRSTHPQTLTNQILAHIARHAPAHAPPAFIGVAWDKFITGLHDALGHLQAAEHPPKPPISRLDDPVVRITVIEAAAHHLTDLSEYQHGRALRFGDTPSRRFFQRFTDKWDNRSLPDISPPAGYPPTTSADNMANGWRDIMSSSYTSPTAGHALITTTHSDLLNTVANRLAHAHLDHLMAPVSDRELSVALARMECSKAPGPDGIPNGFFHEFHVALTPCLLALFNGLLLGHPLPRSFSEADVIPLKKKGNSPHALDYRPIALLNSAYKLFAQIIALRLQPLLHIAIGDQQQGFVPGRTLTDSLGLFQRALEDQASSPSTPLPESAAIICLDIQKAYDSLERPHLECAMAAMGFPPPFTQLISRLHEHTTVRFVVNGSRSAALDQTSGIRQGCPLAPSLFILGMEPLLTSLQHHAWQHGLLIPDGPAITPLICNAHVDDTALYLRHLKSLPIVLDLLHRFGAMSGLKVQPHKSFGICLNTAHHPTRIHDIPFIGGGARRRYLGLQVGLGQLADSNWAHCYQSTVQRLRVASSKTTSLPARARLLQAIVQSKFAFLATPGHLPSHIPSAILQRPRRDDGWALPDLRHVARQQALRSFVHYGAKPGHWARGIALTALRLPHGTRYTLHPATTSARSALYDNSMKYGQTLASKALTIAMKRSQIGQDATQAFLLAARTACTYTWDSTGRCTCHMPPDLVTAATNLQTSLNCATTPAWRQMLWHNQVTHNDWVRDHRARPLKEAPYDTFADAFGSTTTTTRWSFVPRHHATTQDKAHLPGFSCSASASASRHRLRSKIPTAAYGSLRPHLE
ncbi:hypothetical protein DYB37_009729 [Aphanomyces astaci]|uniref:Reverse transcriptase domain-containing protein n=1 Tax=Aphanomyces astaci TaxID=112090 RepID=A0A3R7AZF4_APHAT|nr:hypothetical protein DYB37_009729 [Aphanomyces astaci]